jgi:hypothetical protein
VVKLGFCIIILSKMAAQLAQSSDGPQNRQTVGVSYANAVLNFKNIDSNKENINDIPHTTPKEHGAKEAPARSKTVQKSVKQHVVNISAANSAHDNEDFPEIIPQGRSSRKLPEKVDTNVKVSSRLVNNTYADKSEHGEESCSVIDGDGSNVSDKVPEKKYVEAPLPKINPWTVNKNAASVIRGKQPEAESNSVTPFVTSNEKRVLQPQQQGRVGE